MLRSTIATAVLMQLAWSSVAVAQEDRTASPSSASAAEESATNSDEPASDESSAPAGTALQYIAPKQIEMLIGVRITPADLNMTSTIVTTVFPTDWPEQKVEVVEVNVPTVFQHGFRDLPGGNKQLLLQAGFLPRCHGDRSDCKGRISKSHTVGPTETDQFVSTASPQSRSETVHRNSPYIETTSSEVKKIVREIEAKEPKNDWNASRCSTIGFAITSFTLEVISRRYVKRLRIRPATAKK